MIKVENIETFGWEAAIRGMRNTMNSWDKSDSYYDCKSEDINSVKCSECFCKYDLSCFNKGDFNIGSNDLDLVKRLCKAGTEHRKFLRMIHIQMDVTAPLYWWKEDDTYKIGTVADSCSTMHKITAKEFKLDDFSCEHLFDGVNNFDETTIYIENPKTCLEYTICVLNYYRKKYLESKDKKYWWQLIQLLPSSYNQRRTVDFNYEVAMNVIKQRTNHKLDEWNEFVETLENLPYMKEFNL